MLTTSRTSGIDKNGVVAPSMHPDQFFLLHDTFNDLKEVNTLNAQILFLFHPYDDDSVELVQKSRNTGNIPFQSVGARS
eukprot:7131078-Karenia_brevis.AAC.1